MALVRHWVASPNFSGARGRHQIVCVHTSEGSTSQNGLAGFLANPSSRVSYQTCFDDFGDPNVIVECVRPPNTAWAAMNANSWGVHGCLCTPSGASGGWSRQVWLGKRTMLAKCAAWIAEECARYAIPVVKIDANEIRLGVRGVCGHGDVSAAGAGGSHFDPGPQFPWDHVIALAAGGGPTPEEDLPLNDADKTWIATAINAALEHWLPTAKDPERRLTGADQQWIAEAVNAAIGARTPGAGKTE